MSALPPVPPSAPDRRPADDAARARVGRLLVAQSAALLAMLGAFTLVLPFKVLTLAAALAALVLGVLVFTASRRTAQSLVPRAAAGAGMALALMGLTVGAFPLLLWNETAGFERCTASAVTVRAQQACADDFTATVERRTGVAQLDG